MAGNVRPLIVIHRADLLGKGISQAEVNILEHALEKPLMGFLDHNHHDIRVARWMAMDMMDLNLKPFQRYMIQEWKGDERQRDRVIAHYLRVFRIVQENYRKTNARTLDMNFHLERYLEQTADMTVAKSPLTRLDTIKNDEHINRLHADIDETMLEFERSLAALDADADSKEYLFGRERFDDAEPLFYDNASNNANDVAAVEADEEDVEMSTDDEDGGVSIDLSNMSSTIDLLSDSDNSEDEDEDEETSSELYALSNPDLAHTTAYATGLTAYHAANPQSPKPPKPTLLDLHDAVPKPSQLGLLPHHSDALFPASYLRHAFACPAASVPGVWHSSRVGLAPIIVMHARRQPYAPATIGAPFAVLDVSEGTDWALPGDACAVYVEIECCVYKYFGHYGRVGAPEAMAAGEWSGVDGYVRQYLGWKVWRMRESSDYYFSVLKKYFGLETDEQVLKLGEEEVIRAFCKDALGIRTRWYVFSCEGYKLEQNRILMEEGVGEYERIKPEADKVEVELQGDWAFP